MKANRTQLAELFGVSVGAVDRWTAAGMPVAKRGRRGVAAAYDAVLCVSWVRDRDRKRLAERLAPLPKTYEKQTRASRENLREILRALWIGQDYLIPWREGAPEVLPLREFEELVGLDHENGEFIDWLQLGCPTVPPAPGEKMLRVPLRQAALWRLLLGGLIETSGGDGMRLELGQEMRKLCGMTLGDEDEEAA